MKLPQTLIIELSDASKLFEEGYDMVRENLCLESGVGRCTCQSCTLLDKRNHPDFILIEKPEDKKNIAVETVRKQILPRIYAKPLISKVTCILIKDAQTLSTGAQNALLKTLEEPPEFVRIVLLVDNTENLLETILSRGQTLSLSNTEKVTDLSLLKEIIEKDLVARFDYAEKIAKKDKKEERIDGYHTLNFIDNLIYDIRAFAKLNVLNPTLRKQTLADLKLILDGKRKIKYNTNKRLVLENIMLQTMEPTIYKKGKYE